MLTSATVLPSAKLCINFKTSNPPPPRVRFHPLMAGSTAPNYYSYTSTSTQTTTSSTHRAASCGASLYEVLGIPVGATSHDIKTAYRRLARTCHPDVATIGRKEDSSADEFIRLHAAYSTLSDPQKRAVYDRNLFRRRRPLTAMSGYSGRNWETDQCW